MAIFRNNLTLPVGNNPVSNATADLNGDGHLDLLFTNYTSDTVSVLYGDGIGGFTTGAATSAPNSRQIMVGDLDGDGDIDALATNLAGNAVSVLINDGAGNFVTSSVPVGGGPRGLAVGDLDGDGDLDFVSVNYGSDNLSVMLNNGNGTFTPQVGSPLPTGGSRPVQVVMSDFDGDGFLDLAVTNNVGNSVGILLGNGDGTFKEPALVSTGTGPRGVTAGDVNGDGKADLVVTDFLAGTASILLNNGDGTFAARTTVATGNSPYDVKLGDLDGDGDLDMVVSNSGSSSLSVFFNNGAGVFTPSGLPTAVGISPGGVTLGDFDGDGDLDISSTNFGSNSAHILINTMSRYSVTAGASASEGTSPGGGGELVFVVSRTSTSEAETVTYSLGGTATAGTDYVIPSGTVSFAVGQKTAEIRIALTPDAMVELDESVILTLLGASGGGIIDPTGGHATGTIVNDDTNAPPLLTGDLTATVKEGASYRLTTADLYFTDPDDTAAGVTFTVSGQTAGKVLVNGRAATSFTGAELAAGKVAFVHDGSETTKATFRVSVEDGNEDGSTPGTSTFTFAVTPVNDAPVLTGDLKATVKEGARYTLTTKDLYFTDLDDSAAGVRFTVAGQVAGKVLVGGKAATSFTGAELAAGKVTFVHDGSETTRATFKVSVEDGNEDNSNPVAKTFTFAVTPVNDAPKLGATQVLAAIAEDASTASARKVATLAIVDADGGDNRLSLAGADAKLFEIKNGALWLKKGAKLDFETNPSLDVTVLLDDPTIGTRHEAEKTFKVTVKDVNETLSGTSRNDRLVGTSGDDVLDGRGGHDRLIGGAGDDRLIGGTGVDILTGGAGRDTFVFASVKDSAPGHTGIVNNGGYSVLSGLSQRDIVTDFVRGEDRLDVSQIDADLRLAGDQAFVWRGKGELSGKAGELIFRTFDVKGTANDRTIVYGDVDRDGRADFQIELSGILNLTKGDFLL